MHSIVGQAWYYDRWYQELIIVLRATIITVFLTFQYLMRYIFQQVAPTTPPTPYLVKNFLIYYLLKYALNGVHPIASGAALQPGRVNPDIRVKWVTFSPGHAGRRVKLK